MGWGYLPSLLLVSNDPRLRHQTREQVIHSGPKEKRPLKTKRLGVIHGGRSRESEGNGQQRKDGSFFMVGEGSHGVSPVGMN